MVDDWSDDHFPERVEFSNIFAIHLVVYRIRGRGVSSSTRLDALGKALCRLHTRQICRCASLMFYISRIFSIVNPKFKSKSWHDERLSEHKIVSCSELRSLSYTRTHYDLPSSSRLRHSNTGKWKNSLWISWIEWLRHPSPFFLRGFSCSCVPIRRQVRAVGSITSSTS